MLRCLVGSAIAAGVYAYCKGSHSSLQLWGNGVYNPREGHPDDILNFKNFTPKLIKYFQEENSPNLVKLALGPIVEAGISEEGGVYIWPKVVMNNVKLDEVDDEYRNVSRVPFSQTPVDLCFVKKILFVLDANGDVWQWRYDLADTPEPRKIPALSGIRKIASGEGHFLALDAEGNVWSMGDDTYGQCGLDPFSRLVSPPYLQIKYPNPQKINMLPDKVTDICCGKSHSLALLQNGEVWGWGRNHKYQLANIDEKLGKAAAPVSYAPTRVNGLHGKTVVRLAAGDMFSIFVTDNNGDTEVYGCGVNTRGQLGLGYLTHVTDLIKIQNLSNFVVKDQKTSGLRPVGIQDMQCGAEHCIALMDVGAVYIWGANEYGEQGNRKRTIQEKPLLLKRYRNKQIVSIAARERSSGIIWKD